MSRMLKMISEKKVLIFAVITMALPAISEMALNTLLGVADNIMISRMIGTGALSAVGFANQIVFATIFIFSSFNTGAVAMISRAFGEKEFKKLEKIAEQNVVINLIIGLIVSGLIFYFRNRILGIYSLEQDVLISAQKYFKVIIIGMLPMFLSFSFAATLRGSGNTMTPMIITGIANVINIFGNYVLIKGVGPFPQLGVSGAAISTTISRFFALGLYIYILYVKDSNIKMRFKVVWDNGIVKALWKISLPGAVEQALMQLSFVILGIFISQLETASEGAFRILIQIESISFMPAVGISIATATLVGKALGEKDINKASETGYISSGLGVVWGVIMAVFFMLIPELSLKAFTTDLEVIKVGMIAMPFLALNQPLLNFMIVMSGALRGAGDTTIVMLLTSSRLWFIFLPFSYLFIIILSHGVVGLWYAEILSFIVFSTMIYLRFRSKKWSTLEV